MDSTFGRLRVEIFDPLEASRRSALARIDDGGRLRTQITLVWPLTAALGKRVTRRAGGEGRRENDRSDGQPDWPAGAFSTESKDIPVARDPWPPAEQ